MPAGNLLDARPDSFQNPCEYQPDLKQKQELYEERTELIDIFIAEAIVFRCSALSRFHTPDAAAACPVAKPRDVSFE